MLLSGVEEPKTIGLGRHSLAGSNVAAETNESETHVVLIRASIFGRGFDSRRLHHFLCHFDSSLSTGRTANGSLAAFHMCRVCSARAQRWKNSKKTSAMLIA
jgi:hypothetical protein